MGTFLFSTTTNGAFPTLFFAHMFSTLPAEADSPIFVLSLIPLTTCRKAIFLSVIIMAFFPQKGHIYIEQNKIKKKNISLLAGYRLQKTDPIS